MNPIKVLFLCVHNSARSQMAEAYLKKFGGENFHVESAGLEPGKLNPLAVAVMKEDGIDISQQTSNHIDEYRDTNFDFVITVCDHARESCPYFPSNAKQFHHNFPDPAKANGNETEIMQQFRAVRDMIKDYCKNFADDHL